MGTLFVTLLVLGLGVYTAWRAGVLHTQDTGALTSYLVLTWAWLLLTAWLAFQGVYEGTTRYFAMDAAALIPFVITAGFLLRARARQSLMRWTVSISLQELTWIHVIRIGAMGTILKMLNGALPAHFIVPVGIPDLLFGLSVPVMAWLVFKKRVIGRTGLVVWNVVGSVVFLPTLILIYLSVPSPIQMFFEGPNSLEVFQFPMALVPTLVAPVFIIIHSAAVAKLFTRDPSGERAVQRELR